MEKTLLNIYNFLYAKKILVSSIDTEHCPCPPHIDPPVVNGPSVIMKNVFFYAPFVGGNTIFHVEQLSLSLAPQSSVVA